MDFIVNLFRDMWFLGLPFLSAHLAGIAYHVAFPTMDSRKTIYWLAGSFIVTLTICIASFFSS